MSVRGKFLSDFPHFVEELVNEEDKERAPSIQAGSNTPLSWKCVRCNDTYDMYPNHRCRNGSSCPKEACRMARRHETNAKRHGWKKDTKSKRQIRARREIPAPSSDDEEEWRSPPAEMKIDQWEVSSLGRIRQKRNGKIRKQHYIPQDGYVRKTYGTGKQSKRFLDHVVVARTFIPNPNNLPTVNHINQLRHDNRVVNLEWMSRSEQGYRENKTKSEHGHRRPIEQLTLEGAYIRSWNKSTDAAVALGTNKQNIVAVCLGRRKICAGFRWRYAEPEGDLEGEEWRTVPLDNDFQVTEVSSLGRVIARHGFKHFGTLQRSGYFSTTIKNTVTGKYHAYQVHRLVALAFIENDRPDRIFVNHKDCDRGNNAVFNLEWVTNSENVIHGQAKKRASICAPNINIDDSSQSELQNPNDEADA